LPAGNVGCAAPETDKFAPTNAHPVGELTAVSLNI